MNALKILLIGFLGALIALFVGKKDSDSIVDCIYCSNPIDTEKNDYVTGESLGEYWCLECAFTGSDEG